MTTVKLTGSLGLVSAKLRPFLAFAWSAVSVPPPLRLGLLTNETGDRGWRSRLYKTVFIRTGVNAAIHSELHVGQVLAPFFRSRYREQDIRDDSIGPFRLAIGLRMISVDILSLLPSSSNTCRQKLDVRRGSKYDTMDSGIPCSRYT